MMGTEVSGCLALAMCAAALMLASRMRAPLGADEGYLWFGVQQWRRGRLPHRDFRSYEPARYVWSGLFARCFGDGLLALRVSTHLFFAGGLAAALCMLRRLGLDWVELGAATAMLTLLSHPQHKQFEHGAILAAWAADIALWMQPSAWTLGTAAATVGVALFLGFNLFLYFGAALVLILGWAVAVGLVEADGRTAYALAVGSVVGLLPFAWALRTPGVARAFHHRRVGTVLARGQSNLSLPRPWPWRAAPPQLRAMDRLHQVGFQGTFAALFAMPAAALLLALVWPQHFGTLVPAAALGLFMGHHAASRADPPHITQSLGPACLLGIQICAPLPTTMPLLAAATLWLVWPLHPLVQRRRRPDAFQRRAARDWAIDTSDGERRLLDAVEALATGREGAWLFAAPMFPALYARFAIDSPVYDTFPLYAASDQAQGAMIDGIESSAVQAAVVCDAPIDGRDDLRFSKTHPQVWSHLHAHFAVHAIDWPAGFCFLREAPVRG